MSAAVRRPLLALVGVCLALATWQGFASRAAGGQKVFPTVPETASKLVDLVSTAGYWNLIAETLWLWCVGMAVVAAIAIPVGVAIGSSRDLHSYVRSTIDFMRSIPHVALLPVALVMLGSKQSMVTVMVAIGAIWPLLIQTIGGIESLDSVTRDSARVMQLTWWQQFRHVLLPGAMPYVATGLRLSSSLALIIVVVAGMLAGTRGLGLAVVQAEEGFKPEELYVYVITVGILGLLLNVGFEVVERRILQWQSMGVAK